MAEKVKARKGTPLPKHLRYNEEFKRNAEDIYFRSNKTQEVVAVLTERLETTPTLFQYFSPRAGLHMF